MVTIQTFRIRIKMAIWLSTITFQTKTISIILIKTNHSFSNMMVSISTVKKRNIQIVHLNLWFSLIWPSIKPICVRLSIIMIGSYVCIIIMARKIGEEHLEHIPANFALMSYTTQITNTFQTRIALARHATKRIINLRVSITQKNTKLNFVNAIRKKSKIAILASNVPSPIPKMRLL